MKDPVSLLKGTELSHEGLATPSGQFDLVRVSYSVSSPR